MLSVAQLCFSRAVSSLGPMNGWTQNKAFAICAFWIWVLSCWLNLHLVSGVPGHGKSWCFVLGNEELPDSTGAAESAKYVGCLGCWRRARMLSRTVMHGYSWGLQAGPTHLNCQCQEQQQGKSAARKRKGLVLSYFFRQGRRDAAFWKFHMCLFLQRKVWVLIYEEVDTQPYADTALPGVKLMWSWWVHAEAGPTGKTILLNGNPL